MTVDIEVVIFLSTVVGFAIQLVWDRLKSHKREMQQMKQEHQTEIDAAKKEYRDEYESVNRQLTLLKAKALQEAQARSEAPKEG